MIALLLLLLLLALAAALEEAVSAARRALALRRARNASAWRAYRRACR